VILKAVFLTVSATTSKDSPLTFSKARLFGGLLGTAPVMKTNPAQSTDFILRGGRIPAPIHSFKN